MLRCDRDICDLSMMCERQRQCILILLMQADDDDDALSALSVHIALWVHSNCCCCCCRSRSANHFILSQFWKGPMSAWENVFSPEMHLQPAGKWMQQALFLGRAHISLFLYITDNTHRHKLYSEEAQMCKSALRVSQLRHPLQADSAAVLDTSHHSVEDSGNSSSSHFTIPSLCPLHLLIKGSTRQWTVCTHTHSQHRQHDSVGYRRCLLN